MSANKRAAPQEAAPSGSGLPASSHSDLYLSTRDELLQVLRTIDGRQHGISREELWRQTGLPDRTIRRTMAELVLEGYPVGLAPGSGYTYGDEAGMKRMYADLVSRRATISAKILKVSRNIAKMHDGEGKR